MNNETKNEIKRCSTCRKGKEIDAFLKGNKELKMCFRCREICKKSKNKKKCEHGRQRQTCKLCGGSSVCIHNKRRQMCKLCNDEIKITIETMISQSKHNDKKKNRYNQAEFIDKCFVKNLIEDSENKCYYCNCELQYLIFQGNLATIERLDNSVGHIKGNCVIACRTCNVSKVGDKINKK